MVTTLGFFQDDGITVNFVVTLCDSRFRLYWLCALFGYKAIIQIIGLFLALRIRNIKVPSIIIYSHYITVLTMCIY